MSTGWQFRFLPFSEQGTVSPEKSMRQSTLKYHVYWDLKQRGKLKNMQFILSLGML